MALSPDLFDRVGVRWGLRGDPVLWAHLEDWVARRTATDDPAAQVLAILEEGLAVPTQGGEIRPGGHMALPWTAGEGPGMSAGLIAWDHWQGTLLPLLRRRIADGCRARPP